MSNAVPAEAPIDLDALPPPADEPKRFTLTQMQWWLSNKIESCRLRSGAISPESFLRVESEDIATMEAMHRFFASIYPHRDKVAAIINGNAAGAREQRGNKGRGK